MSKTDCLVIRITPDLKSKLKIAALADNRSVSNYVVMLIRADLEKK